MTIRFRRTALAALWAAAVVAPSCGGDSRPGGNTPVTTLPSPSPTPTPVNLGCSLGMGSVDVECEASAPQLLPQIESAIDMLVNEKPQLLNLTVQAPGGNDQYRVLDAEAYLDTIVDNLRRQSVCAERDGDSLGLKRILVKNSNAYSETFEVLSASGFIRRGQGAYLRTCNPAAFPIIRTADMPPAGSGCGRPYPPPISRFGCKVHLRAIEYYTGDSTPIIGPNGEYCALVGFTDGRTTCAVRPEGFEDREYCENWLVGRARDTGRYGPTWTRDDGVACTGRESNCENDPDNQYQVRVFESGRVRAAATSGAECTLLVER